ncbi:hypothetical protein K438DRAFT_1749163 [Mycena galopus ATCC 62051]|nr:hypothetical protein K438DRAFT_1749163 [Mycena galopus ATCC 62051]
MKALGVETASLPLLYLNHQTGPPTWYIPSDAMIWHPLSAMAARCIPRTLGEAALKRIDRHHLPRLDLIDCLKTTWGSPSTWRISYWGFATYSSPSLLILSGNYELTGTHPRAMVERRFQFTRLNASRAHGASSDSRKSVSRDFNFASPLPIFKGNTGTSLPPSSSYAPGSSALTQTA